MIDEQPPDFAPAILQMYRNLEFDRLQYNTVLIPIDRDPGRYLWRLVVRRRTMSRKRRRKAQRMARRRYRTRHPEFVSDGPIRKGLAYIETEVTE